MDGKRKGGTSAALSAGAGLIDGVPTSDMFAGDPGCATIVAMLPLLPNVPPKPNDDIESVRPFTSIGIGL
jgi:hypothetical protein